MERIPLARRKALAAELLLKGERPTDISRKTGLSFPTLRKYKALLDSGGPASLARLSKRGSRSRLDEEALSWLVSAIKHSPNLHGIAATCWTVEQVRNLILQRFGVDYSASHVAHIIREHGLAYRLTFTAADAHAQRRQRPVSDRDAVRRKAAAEMLVAGQSAEQVSEALNIGLRTVKTYESMVGREGLVALDQLATRDHRSTLDSKALERLKVALEKGPRVHGFESDLWRNRDVQALIQHRFGIYHSNGYVRQLVTKLGLADRMHPPKRRTEKKRVTINDEVLGWVAMTVKQSPREHGIEGDHWNNARLRAVVQQRLGVEFSRGYIREIAIHAGVADMVTRRQD
ncbi:winged helix-turn-helix domain-containing protein [Paraburkholderia aromaticivorans]|uniref:winged helix-turn-helix domain-containing protein n=1 Tax=Paraburkholderia aromaticivorans TaxID=2026199 RepID=UPI0014560CD2|nr:winged helix-turn-helix domain-containing protein [Paraburkholderia aromaticivorans]